MKKNPPSYGSLKKLLLFAIASLSKDRPFLVPFLGEDFNAGRDGDVLVEF